MAFNSNSGKQNFSATAAQTDFDFNFKIYEDTDVKVYLTPVGNEPDDAADLLTLASEYTVSIDGDAGGTVTLLSGATLNDVIVVKRELPVTRTISYVTQGDLRAETINIDQNYQTYLTIDSGVDIDASLRLPDTAVGVATQLPAVISDAYFKWSADGLSIENDTTIPTNVALAVSSAAAAAVSETNAATSETNAATSETNAATSETNAGTSETNADADATQTALDVVSTTADAVQTALDKIATNADVVTTNADVVSTNADVVLTGLDVVSTNADVISSGTNATNAELFEWEAEAERLTADSYATEAEDTFVNIVTSDGDGTFTYTPTSEYSSLHWAAKAAVFNPALYALLTGAAFSGTLRLKKGADVASASTLPYIIDGNYADVTGTTTVTKIQTSGQPGTILKYHFDGILILTHHATDLILPGGANITTAAGDEAEFIEYGAGDYKCTSYVKASGKAIDTATAYIDTAQTFTTAQGTSTTAGDNSIAFNDNNNHTLTATAANITVTNQTIGQDGTIIITTSENITGWGTEFDWGNAGEPTGLTGIETFAYYISGASGADSIKIGRL